MSPSPPFVYGNCARAREFFAICLRFSARKRDGEREENGKREKDGEMEAAAGGYAAVPLDSSGKNLFCLFERCESHHQTN